MAAASRATSSFPPRNEPNDFFNQLLAVYQNELRASLVTHLRGLRGRGDLVDRIRAGSASANAITPPRRTTRSLRSPTAPARWSARRRRSGAIPFPPRNEGLLFMNQLDDTYRDSLRRSLGSSFVNNEGAVVWVLEYLRYRLNGCNHGDATTKVLQQIRGQGIQPVCTA